MEIAADCCRITESSKLFDRGHYVSKNHACDTKIRELESRDGETVHHTCTPIMANEHDLHRRAVDRIKGFSHSDAVCELVIASCGRRGVAITGQLSDRSRKEIDRNQKKRSHLERKDDTFPKA